MKACKCDSGFSNTGVQCSPLLSVQKKLIVVPLFDSTGARNKIAFTDTLNDAYFSALINQSDATKRWFPLPEMKNIADDRGEPIVETFEDNSKIPIQQGVRSFTGLLVKAGIQLLGQLESFPCQEFGIYIVDKDNNLIGTIGTQDDCDPDFLYPIRVDEGSWFATLMKTTDKAVQKIKVQFDIHMDEQDSSLRLITQSEHGVDLSLLEGLLDVCMKVLISEQTELKVTLTTRFGTPISPIVVKGLVVTDFVSSNSGATGKIYNKTTNSDVTISSVTESPSGTYDLTFASQTVGNILVPYASKTGYDFTGIEVQIALT